MRPAPASRKRTWRFYLGYCLFLLLVLVLAFEAALRVLGPGPWKPVKQSFRVEPGGSMFLPDSLLGFKGRPGTFTCSIGDSLRFKLSHDRDGYRITSPAGEDDTLPKPEIWIFGCSFTHGYGVDDSLTWPWKVQAQLPQYRVRNFAMTAYSTYHSYLQLDQLLKREHGKVAAVVLAYGNFHDQRNTASRFWRKALHGQQAAEGIRYPYVVAKGKYAQDPIAIGWEGRKTALSYTPWPLQDWSALVHFLEIQSAHRDERQLRSQEVTVSIVEQMWRMSMEAGASFLVAGVQHDRENWRPLHQTTDPCPDVIDISQDLNDPSLRILPTDGHPNARAHAQMAAAFVYKFINHEYDYGGAL